MYKNPPKLDPTWRPHLKESGSNKQHGGHNHGYHRRGGGLGGGAVDARLPPVEGVVEGPQQGVASPPTHAQEVVGVDAPRHDASQAGVVRKLGLKASQRK